MQWKYKWNQIFLFCKKKKLEILEKFIANAIRVFTIPGTRSFHQFTAIDNNTDGLKKCIIDSSFFKEHKFREDEVHQSFTIQISSFVAVAYEGAWWLGTIREINEAEKDVMVQFLHPKGPSTTFHWPNRDDFNFITFEDILCQITVPKPQTSSLRKFIIESNDLKLIYKKWLDFTPSSKK